MTELNKNEHISLMDAMSEAHVLQLPKEYSSSDGIWVEALVRVQKNNMRINWAIASNDGDGGVIIEKDFGTPAKIVKILNIRPYSLIGKEYFSHFKTTAPIVKFLTNNGYDADAVKSLMSKKKIDGSNKTNEEIARDRKIVKSWIISSAIKNRKLVNKISHER